MANFEKFGHFLTALAMKKRIWPFCEIWQFFGHFFRFFVTVNFSFSFNILSFCIFWMLSVLPTGIFLCQIFEIWHFLEVVGINIFGLAYFSTTNFLHRKNVEP